MISAAAFALFSVLAPAEVVAQPDPAAEEQPSEQPVQRPTAQPQPQPQPAPQPQPQPSGPSVRDLSGNAPTSGERLPAGPAAPATAPNYANQQPQPQPQPTQAPQPLPPAPLLQPSASGEMAGGIAFVTVSPLVLGLGLPLSFAGNNAWRDGCGPNSSTHVCTRGSTQSVLAHTGTGLLYVAGIVFAGVGGKKLGRARALRDRANGRAPRSMSGVAVAGAVVLPLSLVGAGMARLFYWLPTPDCTEYECVRFYQTASTFTVGGLALAGAIGASMLGYGLGHGGQVGRGRTATTVVPLAGRGYAGLHLSTRF